MLVEDRVGDLLFAYGHNAPVESILIGFCFDDGAEIALDTLRVGEGVLVAAERAIVHAKACQRVITAMAMVACVAPVSDTKNVWACVACDNAFNSSFDLLLPIVNDEGLQDWQRIDAPAGQETIERMAESLGMAWSYLYEEGVAVSDAMQEAEAAANALAIEIMELTA